MIKCLFSLVNIKVQWGVCAEIIMILMIIINAVQNLFIHHSHELTPVISFLWIYNSFSVMASSIVVFIEQRFQK